MISLLLIALAAACCALIDRRGKRTGMVYFKTKKVTPEFSLSYNFKNDLFDTKEQFKKVLTMNLIEGLQSEMDRVREIIKEYEAIPAGAFAAGMMRRSIKSAEYAIATGDTIGMMKALNDLKEYEL